MQQAVNKRRLLLRLLRLQLVSLLIHIRVTHRCVRACDLAHVFRILHSRLTRSRL